MKRTALLTALALLAAAGHAAAQTDVQALPELTSPATGDILYAEDVSDTTEDASGSGKHMTFATFETWLEGQLALENIGGTLGTGQAAAGFSLDTEWDTLAEINAATTDDDAAGLATAQTFTAQQTFSLLPNVAWTDLAGGTSLTVNTRYHDDISAGRTVFFSGTPAQGDAVVLRLTVTNTPLLTIPSSKRGGEEDSAVTTLRLWPGVHWLSWQYLDSEWVLFDTLGPRHTTTTSAPTVDDDTDLGYVEGKSTWYRSDTEQLWFLIEDSDGVADWVEYGSATIADDSITAAKFADGDWGDVSVATNSVTLDTGAVDSTAILDGTVAAADVATELVTFSETFTISEPDSVQGVSDDIVLKKFIAEKYPSGVTITSIHIDASSAYTSETFLFEHWDDASGTTQATVESISATSISTEDDGTLSDATIPADYFLVLNLDDTPEDVAYVAITISYTVD